MLLPSHLAHALADERRAAMADDARRRRLRRETRTSYAHPSFRAPVGRRANAAGRDAVAA